MPKVRLRPRARRRLGPGALAPPTHMKARLAPGAVNSTTSVRNAENAWLGNLKPTPRRPLILPAAKAAASLGAVVVVVAKAGKEGKEEKEKAKARAKERRRTPALHRVRSMPEDCAARVMIVGISTLKSSLR